MRISRKGILCLLAVLLMAALLTACRRETEPAAPPAPPAPRPTPVAPPPAEAPAEPIIPEADPADADFYPMDTDVTLRYWVELNANIGANFANWGDTPFTQEWQRRTGVNVEFIHSTTGDAFTLLWLSGDIPDIVSFWWGTPFGGLLGAIAEDAIIPLNELWDEVPLFRAYLDANPAIARMIVHPGGYYPGFPFVMGGLDTLTVSFGLIVREDLLEEAGLPMPVTVDDWTNVLRAFQAMGIESPYSANYREHIFPRAFDAPRGWFIEGDQIRFGQTQPGFRDYLALMHYWYTEGLLDQDFAVSPPAMAKMQDGSAGVVAGWWSDVQMANMHGPTITGNPNFNAVGAPLPRLRATDRYNKHAIVGNPHNPLTKYTCIARASQHPEIAARFMDYLWGVEGNTFANWGIYGVTFETDPTAPSGFRFTDYVFNHPQGWIVQQIRAAYSLSFGAGPYQQDAFVAIQGFAIPQQYDAFRTWSEGATLDNLLPPLMRTREEDTELATIMADVNTHYLENVTRFILGTRSLDEWDQFQDELRRLNIGRAKEIQQAALDRFLHD